MAGSLPAPAHAARALMQQQQQAPPPGGIGGLLNALGLGNIGNGNNNNNPNNNPNANANANPDSLASMIDRALSGAGIPPQQRVREDDGAAQTQQTQTMTARDGNSQSSASATGDVASVDAGADDGLPDTQEEQQVEVVGRGNNNVDDQPVQPATSAARAASSSSQASQASAAAVATSDTNTNPEIDNDPEEDNSPEAPQDFDESVEQNGDEEEQEQTLPPVTNPAVDAGLQRAAAGVNGTYGALSGLLSNLTGGALQLPALDTTGTGGGSAGADPLQARQQPVSAPVTELAPGVVASSAAASALASSSLVAALAGGLALAMMVVV